MKPLKVLQVFTVLNRGGAETNLMNYYRQMDRDRVHFDFLVHRQEEGAYEQEIKKMGGEIFRLPALHPMQIKHYKAAVRKFFDDNPGYQIIHGQCSELGIFIYREAKKRKIPVIIAHAHNSKMDWDQKALFRILWKHGMRKYINTYFSCGQDAAKWLFGKKMAAKAYQMNNAVNTDDFVFNPSLRERMRSKLHAENSFNVIHVGRFNIQKNHCFLIHIFSEIVKINPQSKLFLVGEGELKKEIETKIHQLNLTEKVEFLGLRSDVADLLQAMDVFVFPSWFEGLPVALVEAQTSGILCAVSDAIPREAVLVPDIVEVCSLQDSAKYWAEKMIKRHLTFIRTDVSHHITKVGYDIKTNASKLEQKYSDLIDQFS
ncbi:glycosyltransferase family 1 protein [Chryseobacterium gotjawalense]|uniref:Glycosyltransferase family 1 protein n=1 Tax=Chryseobacterium gotjawalense TaxID=3042315 RepID=A0ABY8RE53_9FLAO|nr:glycosyltransferase family 1 protein [Chryseobacterium sp. wdc7]WHF51443.1 glycosyltransferase family 1 protein [Chryseobacterium sp. wdc7]